MFAVSSKINLDAAVRGYVLGDRVFVTFSIKYKKKAAVGQPSDIELCGFVLLNDQHRLVHLVIGLDGYHIHTCG